MVTVQVSPEALGPVVVRAHVAGSAMRVELFAQSDAARDAVRQILPDLRRDLQQQGVSSSLDLSNQNQPSAGHHGQPPSPDSLRAAAAAAAAAAAGPAAAPLQQAPTPDLPAVTTVAASPTTIDVMA